VPASRSDSQAETREALLAVAEKRFVERGYDATTLAEIAAAAGYTKGAVYSNFASKAALFQEVWSLRERRRLPDLVAALGEGDGIEDRLRMVQDWLVDFAVEDQAWWRAATEYLVDGLATAEGQRDNRDRHRDSRAMATVLFEQELRASGVGLPENWADEEGRILAEALIALFYGLALTRSIDPAIPVQVYGDALRFLVTGMLAQLPGPPA